MTRKQKLELIRIGKEERPRLKPRILLALIAFEQEFTGKEAK